MKTRNILLLVMLACSFEIYGQQFPIFNQYNLNPLIINPAFAGSSDGIHVTAAYRQQWTAIEGAPKTFSLAGHTMLDEYNSGVGLHMWSDKVGEISQTGFFGSYNYKIPFEFGTLSAGLSIGMLQFRTEFATADLNGVIDNTFLSGDVNQWKFNGGIGLYLDADKYFVGFSIPQAISSTYQNSESIDQITIRRQIYLTGGYIFQLSNPKIEIKPYTMVRLVSGSPVEWDLNVQAYYDGRFSVGLQYRSTDAMAVLLEFVSNNNLFFGYSYEFNLGNKFDGVKTGGSHEIVVSYIIPWEGLKETQ